MDAIRLQADYQVAQMRHNSNPTTETAEKLAQTKEAYDRALNAEIGEKIGADIISPEAEKELDDTDEDDGAEEEQEDEDEQGNEKKQSSKKKQK